MTHGSVKQFIVKNIVEYGPGQAATHACLYYQAV